jgi:hypothetical protein
LPVARPDHVTTLPGTPVTFRVLDNDEGQGLTLIAVTSPAFGGLAVHPDRSMTYTPAAGFVGTDGFTYVIRDDAGATAEGGVTLVVNSPPVARDDAAATTAGVAVDIAVLANDDDPDGDPLTLAGVATPGHGTVEVLPDQRLRYRPQEGFTGGDSFAYSVMDPRGAGASAMVSVTVSDPNRPPVAAPDVAATTAGNPVTLDLLANDSDPDGDPLTLTGFTLPAHGSLAVNVDRTVTYTPAPGFLGADGFTYTIADGRGGTAVGEVTITVVEEPNRPPVAAPDVATTPAGTPVTLDLLANDSDPDGDPLTLTGLTLPAHGTLTVNPDRSVTYTPAAGFEGEEGFTYAISDGRGGTAVGEVTITVLPPAPPAFPNGYRWRRRLLLPARGTAETVAGFVLLVSETGEWLKSSGQGGQIESAQGLDIHFELEDGTPLAYEVELYDAGEDAEPGRLVAWVRLPSWALAQELRLFLYYGKAGLAQREVAAATTWQDYLAVWDARSGADRSGQGRDLVANAPIAAGALIGEAGRYDGAQVLRSTDFAWLDGHAALTVQTVIQADPAMIGSNHGWLCQGPLGDGGGQFGLALRHRPTPSSGSGTNPVFAAIRATLGTSILNSAANAQTTAARHVHVTWSASPPAIRMYLDGKETVPVSSSAFGGTTLMQTAGTNPCVVAIGGATLDSANGGWRGLVDEVRLRAQALSPGQIAAEAASMADPRGFYGIGDEDGATDAVASVVAAPIAVGTAADTPVEVDVLARALVPPGGGSPTIAIASPPAGGVASVAGGLVNYAPAAGFSGGDRFTYTLSADGKASTAAISVTVAATTTPPPPPGSGTELPPALRTVNVATSTQLANAVAAALPGDHIVLADGSYSGPGDLTRAGTEANPIVVRAANLLGARITTNSLSPAADFITLYGLDLVGVPCLPKNGAKFPRIWRCRFRDRPASSFTRAIRLHACTDADIAYCEFTNWAGAGFACAPGGGALRFRVRRCLFRNTPAGFQTNGTEAMLIGLGSGDQLVSSQGLIEECRVAGWNSDTETISLKTSDCTLRRVTAEGCSGRLSNRMGQRNLWDALWVRNGAGIRIHDADNKVLGCKTEGASQGGIRVAAGNAQPGTQDNSKHCLAANTVVAGCDSPLEVGAAFGGQTLPARDTVIRQHTGPITLVPGLQTGTDSQPGAPATGLTWSPLVFLTDSDVGPTAGLG